MLLTSADIKRPRSYPIAITQYRHPHHHCLLLPQLISHQPSHTNLNKAAKTVFTAHKLERSSSSSWPSASTAKSLDF